MDAAGAENEIPSAIHRDGTRHSHEFQAMRQFVRRVHVGGVGKIEQSELLSLRRASELGPRRARADRPRQNEVVGVDEGRELDLRRGRLVAVVPHVQLVQLLLDERVDLGDELHGLGVGRRDSARCVPRDGDVVANDGVDRALVLERGLENGLDDAVDVANCEELRREIHGRRRRRRRRGCSWRWLWWCDIAVVVVAVLHDDGGE